MLNKKWDSKISYPIPLYGSHMPTTFVTRKNDAKISRLISNVNLMTSQLEVNERPEKDNEIIQRAVDMSHMVCDLYLFTRGEGTLLCTTDFFEAAKKLAETGQALWKVAKQHAIKVDDSEPKQELMRYTDKLLAYCQQLIFTSSSLSVGQTALYRKVQAVMNLTKIIIKIVGRVVNRCYLVTEESSPLRLPPDQRLWRIDENIFSEASSLNTSRKSSTQNLNDIILDWLSDEESEEKIEL